MSDSEKPRDLRLCVGGPFDGQWMERGPGQVWPIQRTDGSLAWYRADPNADTQALYVGAAPPEVSDSPANAARAREEEAETEELERDQDSAT